ncbi:hypothetical protein OCEANICA350_11309 [Oceanicaulis sp. 350]|nr:hypothetical protein OCEANICA350_11309 [Oceanicaulis sp. 350]
MALIQFGYRRETTILTESRGTAGLFVQT